MTARYILHEFLMGDVEDPEIYMAAPIYEWQQTAEGKFCMEKADDCTYTIAPDNLGWGYKITITGVMKDKYATYMALKTS
jgi:hypothetical protein